METGKRFGKPAARSFGQEHKGERTSTIQAGIAAMKITRLSTGPDGHTYFSDVELDFTMKEALGLFTSPVPAKAVFFREISPGYSYPWHTVLCREYVVTLSGSAEIEASSGEKRRFRKGDVFLVEDITGRGHRTRCTSRTPWRQIFVTLHGDDDRGSHEA